MKDAKPDPAMPVLMRLDTIEAGQSGDQNRLVTLENRIEALETRLSHLLGVDVQWTPPPPAGLDGTNNVTVRARR